ncbi:fatty acid metabolism transcriptional regulator FadR [Vibrio barjaei]|uniref:fatty acid metabolism transcriptional regulator FadR n=1 Tax=Vibrio barjaei TaxID=1676683 RepID=UPI0022834A2E|nr:fatty acid metabolism transcriptional regulator FadR [Vibrio barjaei]MCY9872385.1 fatty acid metabolism transcriptional regulator FadR [Vibrio barjaei]
MDILNATTPNGLAETYLIDSIVKGKYEHGKILPAERELAEHIGVTRTTLREVTGRMGRDGWLTIRHGRPTRVNDIKNTLSLTALNSLCYLDEANSSSYIKDILDLRCSVAPLYISSALVESREGAIQVLGLAVRASELMSTSFDEFRLKSELFEDYKASVEYGQVLVSRLEESENIALSAAWLDFWVYQQLAHLASNKIYGLVVNSLKPTYMDVLSGLYQSAENIHNLRAHHRTVLKSLKNGKTAEVLESFDRFGAKTMKLWNRAA